MPPKLMVCEPGGSGSTSNQFPSEIAGATFVPKGVVPWGQPGPGTSSPKNCKRLSVLGTWYSNAANPRLLDDSGTLTPSTLTCSEPGTGSEKNAANACNSSNVRLVGVTNPVLSAHEFKIGKKSVVFSGMAQLRKVEPPVIFPARNQTEPDCPIEQSTGPA